jgi:alkyl hydroperoxide reductase subunit AhpF
VFTDNELARVQSVAADLASPITLRLISANSGSQFESNLRNIALQMNGVSLNKIRFEEVNDFRDSFLPFLSLVENGGERIRYYAAPEGPELEPFLEAIKLIGGGERPSNGSPRSPSETDSEACNVFVFIAPSCPHCPGVVRKCITLGMEMDLIRLSVIDALHFGEWAERYKVQATPTIVIDDGLTVVGNVSLDELRSYVAKRNKPEFMTFVLESMINTGRAEDAAALLCERNSPAALLPLYESPVFAQRMGALVVMEEALSRNPRILDPIVDHLISLTSHEDAGLRGDTAELLGNIGDPRAIPALERLQNDPDGDVREAAAEALEKLHEL